MGGDGPDRPDSSGLPPLPYIWRSPHIGGRKDGSVKASKTEASFSKAAE
jgi:hypothetical protein